MGKSNVQADIDNKFDEAVDTNIGGGGDDEIDEFLGEAFDGIEEEGGVADYEEDLGYDITEEETDDTDESEEEEVEEEVVDEEEVETDEDEEEEEVVDEEVDEEEEVETDEDEDEEEEFFYDGERDYGEAPGATQYQDRMSLNHGLVAKVSYFSDLNKRLQEAGSDLGAISLPEGVDGDPENLKQFADIEQVLSLPDEQAKKMVHEMDNLLRNMKQKATRVEEAKKKEAEKQEVTQEYLDARQTALASIETLGLDIKEGMTNEEVLNLAYARLEEFEADEDTAAEMSQKEFVNKIREMEDAIVSLEDFAEIAVKQAETQTEGKKEKKVSAEEVESAFNEFLEDRPDLDMVKNNRTEMQRSLIQTAMRKGWKVATARDWLNNYRKYMEIVNANRADKGLKKLKDSDSAEDVDKKAKTSAKKKKTGRAKKYADKKPAKSNGSLSYSNRSDKKSVDKLDDEIDRIASELTQGGILDDEW